MDRDDLLARIEELRAEIEELNRVNRNFLRIGQPSKLEYLLHDQRIARLEKIKREIEQIAATKLQ